METSSDYAKALFKTLNINQVYNNKLDSNMQLLNGLKLSDISVSYYLIKYLYLMFGSNTRSDAASSQQRDVQKIFCAMPNAGDQT